MSGGAIAAMNMIVRSHQDARAKKALTPLRWRVEVYYATKRGGVCCGIEVEAESDDEALEKAKAAIIGKSKARKFHAATIERIAP